jgi:putative (di)nucleoside polyphosphate hydrolase
MRSSHGYETPEVTDPREPLCSGPGPFRENVAALVLREDTGSLLLGERVDTPGYWQWPQGGVEPGEDLGQALARELWEEIGLRDFTVLGRLPVRLRYYFPLSLFDRFRPNLGQEQTYFLVRADEAPDLARATDHEFRALRWCRSDRAADQAIWFKAPVYRRVLELLDKGMTRKDLPVV